MAPDLLAELFSGADERAEAALPQLQAADIAALQSAALAPEEDTRWWAVRALVELAARLGPETAAQVTPNLLRAALDAAEAVRAAALFGLGYLRLEAGLAPLLLALAEEPYLSRLAADALIQLGQPAAPGLLRALESDAQPFVRTQAARALALIGDPAAIPLLFKALDDESPFVQYWAEEGLERLGVGQVYFKV